MENWADLQEDLLAVIFNKLGAVEVLISAQAVCRSWRHVALTPGRRVWGCIDMRYTPAVKQRFHLDPPKCRHILGKLARLAFHRSDGQVEQLYVTSITNDFLADIIGRTTRLRCFALLSSPNISPKELAGFVGQCPLLEELHIYRCGFSAKSCMFVARERPELRCLRADQCNADHDPEYCYDSEDEYQRRRYRSKYDRDVCDYNFPDQQEVMRPEIVFSMFEMRHLQLTGIWMSNETLHTLLDNCLHLEYLDIRCSFGVFVDHQLQAKLAKIKTVRVSRRSLRETSSNNQKPFIQFLIEQCDLYTVM